MLFAEGEVEDEIDDVLLVLLEEGTAQVGLLDVVVEVYSCAGLLQELAASRHAY
jgi:hypothetical protein